MTLTHSYWVPDGAILHFLLFTLMNDFVQTCINPQSSLHQMFKKVSVV